MKGVIKKDVEVEVKPVELLEALSEVFGLSRALGFTGNNDSYFKREYNDEDELVALVEYEDRSYHGSPNYQPTGVEITNRLQLDAYNTILQLQGLLNKQEEISRRSING